MDKYIIMGMQGSGKGTQAKRLAEEFDLVHVNVGDMFRWHVKNHTKLGARVKRIVSRGELVPDEVVEAEVKSRLEIHDWNYGFILDGFPRNEVQAAFFLESYDVDAVIQIDVAEEVVMERILSRRLCSQCGLDYNLIYHRPEEPGKCDVCGGSLVTRDDDTPEAVKSRLMDYQSKTLPILELFEDKELVIRVDGARGIDEVYSEIIEQLAAVRRQ